MIKSQVTSDYSVSADADSHLISFSSSTLLAQAGLHVELLCALQKDASTSVADCSYGSLFSEPFLPRRYTLGASGYQWNRIVA